MITEMLPARCRSLFQRDEASRWDASRVMGWSDRGMGKGRVVIPCYLVTFAAGMLRSACPGTGGEGGREKSRASECRSKLPYLPYQISTWISNADSSKARLLAARQWQLAASCSGRPV
jgi:hypothetical protein